MFQVDQIESRISKLHTDILNLRKDFMEMKLETAERERSGIVDLGNCSLCGTPYKIGEIAEHFKQHTKPTPAVERIPVFQYQPLAILFRQLPFSELLGGPDHKPLYCRQEPHGEIVVEKSNYDGYWLQLPDNSCWHAPRELFNALRPYLGAKGEGK